MGVMVSLPPADPPTHNSGPSDGPIARLPHAGPHAHTRDDAQRLPRTLHHRMIPRLLDRSTPLPASCCGILESAPSTLSLSTTQLLEASHRCCLHAKRVSSSRWFLLPALQVPVDNCNRCGPVDVRSTLNPTAATIM